jgi:hypothetical protein
VDLNAAQAQRLDALSDPQLPFPTSMVGFAGSFMHGGITVNGAASPPSPYLPTAASPRF